MQDELKGLREMCDESKELLESQKRSIQELGATQIQHWEEAKKSAEEVNRANQERVNRKIGEALERADADTEAHMVEERRANQIHIADQVRSQTQESLMVSRDC